MNTKSQAVLISYNINGTEICASAARISTTKGNAVEIFEKAKDHPKNQELIQKVFASGHKSVIEHAVFTIALQDVSAFVEQFFIENRLASFTVKSRRYVDFSNLGYHIPQELEGKDLEQYCQYMNLLFQAYQTLLEQGIPKEDARFLLPYSFHSNFYCTLNARELFQVLSAIRHGRGQDIPELQDLADQIIRQVETILPGIFSGLGRQSSGSADAIPASDPTVSDSAVFKHTVSASAASDHSVLAPAASDHSVSTPAASDHSVLAPAVSDHIRANDSQNLRVSEQVSFIMPENAGSVRLLNAPAQPSEILKTAYLISNPNAAPLSDLDTLLKSSRPRELEQLSYSFVISDVTLSGLTHLVRHRMQSIVIPSIQSVDHSRFILPDTIRADAGSLELYRNTLEKANAMAIRMSTNPMLQKYGYYYALSGNVMDIMTTMNARELKHFIQLRTCSRAQWEIRKFSIEMLRQLRNTCPELFGSFGPGCYANGVCPEGKMSCGNMAQVTEQFRQLNVQR